MKLLLCPDCMDVRAIRKLSTTCECGNSDAEAGTGRILEINDESLALALRDRPHVNIMFYVKLLSTKEVL